MECAKKGCWRYDETQKNNCGLVDEPKEDCEEFEPHKIDQDAGISTEWFNDEKIIKQDQVMIRNKSGENTVGVSLIIKVPKYIDSTEIILEYDQLKACLNHLGEDIDS